jgi:hypothetical protein
MLILTGYLFQLTRLHQHADLHVIINPLGSREMLNRSTMNTPMMLRNLSKLKSGAKKRQSLLRHDDTAKAKAKGTLNGLHGALHEFRINRPPDALVKRLQAFKDKAVATEAEAAAAAAAMQMYEEATVDPTLNRFTVALKKKLQARKYKAAADAEVAMSEEANGAITISEETIGDPSDPLVKLPVHSCQIGDETLTMPQIPSFIIVGTQKGGTSTLHGLLSSHPGIEASTRFEPHFFDRDKLMREYRSDLTPDRICTLRQHYAETVFPTDSLEEFPRLSFEKSPAYMVVPGVPTFIHKVVPWAKIIVTLRNPVDRAFSHFRMKREREQEFRQLEEVLGDELSHLRLYPYFPVPDNAPFEIPVVNNTNNAAGEAATTANVNLNNAGSNASGTVPRPRPKLQGILYRGCYHHQLRNWMRHYTLGENLLVINYERLDRDPESVLKEILDFVGAPEYEFTDQAFNKSYSPSQHWSGRYTESMSNTTRQYLEDFYRPMNDKLAGMLGEEWRGIWDKEHRSGARTVHAPNERPAKVESEDASEDSEEEDEDEEEDE